MRLLTAREVATRLAVSPSLVYALCAGGLLPHLRLGGPGRRGCLRVREEDLEAFLKARVRRGVVGGEATPPGHLRP